VSLRRPDRRRVGTHAVRAVLGLVLLSVGLVGVPSGHAATSVPATDGMADYSYTNAAGTRAYSVHLPPQMQAGLPLVVNLHGCTETVEDSARRSHFNEVADRLGFIVVYPQQDSAANGALCWNWFLNEHTHRGRGEPSLIAGITRDAQARWQADPRRTYVFGISAGGAMANIMAVTYPDLYAAAGLYAACEFRGLPCAGSAPATPWHVAARNALAEMGPRARVIPIFVIQGSIDVAVPAVNATYVVQQFLTQDHLMVGKPAGAQPTLPDHQRDAKKPGLQGRRYTISQWHSGTGRLIAEQWLIHGMGHQWSNAQYSGDAQRDADNNDLLLNDPNGPDVTTPAAQFFLAHPRP
jgi:poly(hydroxyalkanoate) depolymerase family esterase